MQEPAQISPFRKAEPQEKRLKLFLWGEWGSGKTTLALQFPKPAVIDLEAGSQLYGDQYDFGMLAATTPDQVMAAVDWLATKQHPYTTLVIDPITVYWDALQRKWSDIFLQRNKSSKGFKFEFYDLQPKDWMAIKSELKALIRKLNGLDMNVIVTAREKTLYAEGSFMRAIGETFDGEKSLPYLFDSIVRLYRDKNGRYMAKCLKDRSGKLPATDFECRYELFESAFSHEALNRAVRGNGQSPTKAVVLGTSRPVNQTQQKGT